MSRAIGVFRNMVWYGMFWYPTLVMVCYGMIWNATLRYEIVCYGMLICGIVWYATLRYGTVWYSTVWYGMIRYGSVWYGLVRYSMGFLVLPAGLARGQNILLKLKRRFMYKNRPLYPLRWF